MDLLIRRFRPSDTILIMQLFRETVHAIGARYYTKEQVMAWAPLKNWTSVEREADEARWQKNLEQNYTIVAELGGVIVGFVDMGDTGQVNHLYVHKEYQARGIGYRLFKEIEKIARDRGIVKLTTHASVMAMPLAKRIGFVIIQEETVIREGVSITRYLMEKLL